jgi:hypothetical protein
MRFAGEAESAVDGAYEPNGASRWLRIRCWEMQPERQDLRLAVGGQIDFVECGCAVAGGGSISNLDKLLDFEPERFYGPALPA